MSVDRSRGRLLVLSTNLGLGGGAEEQVMQLAVRLKARGWDLEMTSMLPPSPLPADLKESGIPVRSLNMRRGVADPVSLFKLARQIRRFRPDVLHTHMTHANIMGRVARRLQPVPVLVSTLHGLKMHRVNGGSTRMRELGHRITDPWADLTTTVCKAAAESYIHDRAVPAEKVLVVPNGVDTTQLNPNAANRESVRQALGLGDTFTWIAVGRFEKPKAYGTMVRAFARVCRQSTAPCTLLICGGGSLEEQTRAEVRDLGIADRVRFMGVRRDVPQLMNAADAFALSSDTEGLPMVLLQASASGLPVVATSVGGNPEIVEHGRTGFLVQPGDPEAFASAMSLMASLPTDRRSAMGAAARAATCANFDIEQVVSRWERLYTSLLDPASKRNNMHTSESLSVRSNHSVPPAMAHAQQPGVLPHTRQNVPVRVSVQAADSPDDIAVTGGGETLTYQQLNERSNQLARHLMSLGVAPEVPVGLYMERSTAFATAALAIMKAGGAYVPVDPAWPPERVHYVLKDAQAPVLVTHRWMAAGLPAGTWSTVDVDIDRVRIGRHSAADVDCNTQPDDLAYIIYTSGSTGWPKGVEITHAGLSNLVAWHQRAFRITPADRASQVAGLGFDAAVWELWPYLTAGASVHFADEISRRSPEALQEFLLDQDISIGFAPTVLAEELIRLDWPASARLRTLLTGADTLHRYPSPSLPFTLINNYGPTECTVVATSGIVPSMPRTDEIPSIGRAIANTEIYILDEHLKPVRPGEIGELCIGGPSLARGYRNMPELTAQKFVRMTMAGSMSDRFFRTGDRARFLPNGEIAFLGRADDQIKIRGYRIEPDGIVARLNQHPEVRNSTVIARDNGAGERTLVAYVAMDTHSILTSTELRNHLSATLPDYMIPQTFVRLAALPVNTSGKCDRAALPEPASSNILRNEARGAVAGTGIEGQISGIVTRLVKVEQVGRDDNFFLIGGHSMLAAQLLVSLREAFGVSVSLRELFEAPTVASLSAKIEQLISTR